MGLSWSRRVGVVLGVGGAAAATATVAVVAHRRRRAAGEPTPPPAPPLDHQPLAPLAGDERTLTMDDGATIFLTEAGAGDTGTAVLVHGWVNDRRVWAAVQPRLVDAGFRVVAYDQRGHGRSTLGTAECTISRLGADLLAVLDQLDLHDVVVTGHSMGGMSAQSMLIDQPEARHRVKGVVLVATGAAGIGLPPWLRAVGELVIGWKGGDAVLRGPQGLAWTRATFGRTARREHLEATRQMVLETPPAVRRTFIHAMQLMDLRDGLRDIAVPTTVVVGSADVVTPPFRARLIASSIPGAKLELLPGRGHMLPWEAPDEILHLVRLAAKSPVP